MCNNGVNNFVPLRHGKYIHGNNLSLNKLSLNVGMYTHKHTQTHPVRNPINSNTHLAVNLIQIQSFSHA